MVGVLNVVVRRVRPLLLFHLRLDLRRASGPREGTALHRIAGELGVLPDVRVVSSEHGPLVFTAGVMRPRIYLSDTVLACLTPTELDLVLRHEAAHCRARDPLRSMMATVLGDLFFWLPMARALIRRVITKIEVNADEAAASIDRLALAGTILKVASLTAVEAPRGVVHFSPSHGSVPWRVRRLIHSERGAGEELGKMKVKMKGTALILLALWTLGLTAYGTHSAHQEVRPNSEVHSSVLAPSDGAASPIVT